MHKRNERIKKAPVMGPKFIASHKNQAAENFSISSGLMLSMSL